MPPLLPVKESSRVSWSMLKAWLVSLLLEVKETTDVSKVLYVASVKDARATDKENQIPLVYLLILGKPFNIQVLVPLSFN